MNRRGKRQVHMNDRAQELEDVRLDIETLRTMIDLALDGGARGEDILLRACANVLHDKRRRLDELERMTIYVSKGNAEHPLR